MIGTTLSHYLIEAELGRGGMGIVYRATDTTLDRTVAIKVLPSAALATDDDRARFYREAKSAAALNHPNIAAVYQIGETVPSDAPHGTQPSPFIAMEYIEGETLEARIRKGPLKLAEAVELAKQIADGLKAAHAKDIVHRDIKAANVMLDGDGRAKILDFGLALTSQSTKLTRMGSTLGTVAYMSPEQARGEEVDERTDLWALGVVLYEMIAGVNPFGGDYEQAVVYSILNADPEPLTALRTGVPMELERIVAKCIAKQTRSRYQSTIDLLVDLENVDVSQVSQAGMSTTSKVSTATSARKRSRSPVLIVLGIACAALVFFVGRWTTSASDRTSDEGFQKIPIVLKGVYNGITPRMSNDRRFLTISGTSDEGSGIFVFDFSTGEVKLLPQTDNRGDVAELYDISPDGEHLTFVRQKTIQVVRLPTGMPRTVSDFGAFPTWISNDVVSFSEWQEGKEGGPLYTVNIRGGEPELYVDNDSTTGVLGHLLYALPVPDREHLKVLFKQNINYGISKFSGLVVQNDKTGKAANIEEGFMNSFVMPNDFIAFQIGADNADYVAQKFDYANGTFIGERHVFLEDAYYVSVGINTRGDLLIASNSHEALKKKSIQIVDLETYTVERVAGTINSFPSNTTLSGNERFIYLYRLDGNGSTIYRYDRVLKIEVPIQLAPNTFYVNESISGTTLVSESHDVNRGIYLTDVAASSTRLLIPLGESPEFSPDETLVFYSDQTQLEIAPLRRYAMVDSSIVSIDETDGFYDNPRVSSDGNWVAYDDLKSGLIKVAKTDGSLRIPLEITGSLPIWGPKDSSIYFRKGKDIFNVRVSTGARVTVLGDPEFVLTTETSVSQFDVTRDGKTLIANASDIWFNENRRKEDTVVEWWKNWSQTLEEN